MPAQPTHEVGPVGESAARAVAFGGGDERFIAWLAGYTSGLAASGGDLAQADVTVGTSAGSIVGAVVKEGVLRLHL
jgi:NTE family protein